MKLLDLIGRRKPYKWIREPKKIGGINFTDKVVEKINKKFTRLGYPVQPLNISIQEYSDYFNSADYGNLYPHYYPYNIKEKSLEHYIAAKLLELGPQDIYIDIASEGSPVPEIYNRLFGVTSYRQDLTYPEGFNGNSIGGDAAKMPVPDEFASQMALHCSLEHFEGDADTRFFQEAIRVLKPGGRVCVVPFYVHEKFSVLTDPNIVMTQTVEFDKGAVVYCVEGWGNRHGRFYDPRHFVDRIASAITNCKIQIFQIINAHEIDPSCYARYALLVEKVI